MILIIAPAKDIHAILCRSGPAQAGSALPDCRLARLLATGGRLQFRAGGASGNTWTDLDGQPVDLDQVQTVWHRRRFHPELPARASELDWRYYRREWNEMLTGVLASMGAWFVNDPNAQDAAVKPLQLRIAEQLGLRIPDTLITNDPLAAEAFVDRHAGQAIHKALAPPQHRFLATAKWSEKDRAFLGDLALSPVIFQELVTDCRELRITVVGEQLFAAQFHPGVGLIDGRLNTAAHYRPHPLPVDVAATLLALMKRLGLVFSTIDMKLTDDGQYVFLELNPMGQFLYVEILVGLP